MFPAVLQLGPMSGPENKSIKIECKAFSSMHIQKCYASALFFCFLNPSNSNKAEMLKPSVDNLKLRFMFSFDSHSLWKDLIKGGPFLFWVEEGKNSSTMGFGMIKIPLLNDNTSDLSPANLVVTNSCFRFVRKQAVLVGWNIEYMPDFQF